MDAREEAILEALKELSSFSKGFAKPKFILIGGYALRAYVDIARYTRDCDFVVERKSFPRIQKSCSDFTVEALHEQESYGYLRLLRLLKTGKKSMKISIDFMEGEVVGRLENDRVVVDERFFQDTKRTSIEIAGKMIEVNIPQYIDYLILKLASARPSDIRDIVTLVWRKGIPKKMKSRIAEIVPDSELIPRNLAKIIATIEDKRFVDSWRGTFVVREFSEEDKNKVVGKLEGLKVLPQGANR